MPLSAHRPSARPGTSSPRSPRQRFLTSGRSNISRFKLDGRSVGPYMGRRQPHKSRKGRAKKVDLHSGGVPGPGAYQLKSIFQDKSAKPDITGHISPRFSMGKAKRFQKASSAEEDFETLVTKSQIHMPPMLGEQVQSNKRSCGSVSIGRASRAAAQRSSVRIARQGLDSPGPIYFPQPGTRESEKRFGIRPKMSARQRLQDFGIVASSIDSAGRRPMTSGGSRLSASSNLSPRPGTSFGLSSRPPLYSGANDTPGPCAYKLETQDGVSTFGKLSSFRSPANASFGAASRDDRKKLRGVNDNDHIGIASPGPIYFTSLHRDMHVAELATKRGAIGPSYTIGAKAGAISMFKEVRPRDGEPEQVFRPDSSSITSLGTQTIGVEPNQPRFAPQYAPRFGQMSGFVSSLLL